MATYKWSVPIGKEINGQTYIKDTDNKIYDTISDLVDFVNSEGTHTGAGLVYDLVDKTSSQTITGVKTFTNGINSNVAGNVTGNSSTATKLETARTISLTGDVTGSVSFDGSNNANIVSEVANDSHTHDTRYYTESEVDTLLSGKQNTGSYVTTSSNQALHPTDALSIIGSMLSLNKANGGSETIAIPSDLGNSSLTSNGYQKFNNGLIVQWGSVTATTSATGQQMTFPIPFPTTCLQVLTQSNIFGGAVDPGYFNVNSKNTVGFTTTYTCSRTWFAIGY